MQTSDIGGTANGRGIGVRAWREQNESGYFCDQWKPVSVLVLHTTANVPVCSDDVNMPRALDAEVSGRAKDNSRATIPP
jgi:hypothetical protein